jgi:hypothetical protein
MLHYPTAEKKTHLFLKAGNKIHLKNTKSKYNLTARIFVALKMLKKITMEYSVTNLVQSHPGATQDLRFSQC